MSTPDTAAEYQTAFDGLRNAGTNWRSSDGSLPVDLQDGRILWMFGDTIDGSGNLGPRNSFVVQTGECFRPILNPLPAPASGQWLWPAAGLVEGNVLRIFALQMLDPPGQGPFDFAYVKMVVASFSLATLTHLGTTDVPVPTNGSLPSYGQTVVEPGDGFVYAYGNSSTGTGLGTIVNHFVARVPAGAVTTGTWEVWDGNADPSEWSSDPGDRAPLSFSDPDADPAGPDDGPRAPLSVAAVTGGFLGSALAWDVLSDQLETWDAPAPQGPFAFRALARDIWPIGPPPNQFGYGGRVVFGIPGAPIALWSINHDSVIDPSVYKAIFATPLGGSVP